MSSFHPAATHRDKMSYKLNESFDFFLGCIVRDEGEFEFFLFS